MSQTSYSINHSVAYEGTRGDSRPMRCDTGKNTAAGELPYGRALVINTSATNVDAALAVKPIDATGQVVQGFSLSDLAHEPQTTGVAVGELVNVMRQGTIWVLPEQAVGPNDPVFVRHTLAGATGTNPALGKVRKDADTAKADALPNARFGATCLAGEPCPLIINIP